MRGVDAPTARLNKHQKRGNNPTFEVKHRYTRDNIYKTHIVLLMVFGQVSLGICGIPTE